eukprot:TRINITY_DN3192_c0_g1_i2.p1 TRINITY_DN3192_c0_g1~~TRINITY_DN3192_c0_g1_i2.p1  ORF type:complete len:385 (+),score=96.35 TRINITY_DN3192_c0_g1_i2:156-1310(+)
MSKVVDWTDLFSSVPLISQGVHQLNKHDVEFMLKRNVAVPSHQAAADPTFLVKSLNSMIGKDEGSYPALYRHVGEWLRKNQSLVVKRAGFQSTTLGEWVSGRCGDLTWAQFCDKMVDQTVWPNIVTLLAISHLLNAKFWVYMIEGDEVSRSDIAPQETTPTITLRIIFLRPANFVIFQKNNANAPPNPGANLAGATPNTNSAKQPNQQSEESAAKRVSMETTQGSSLKRTYQLYTMPTNTGNQQAMSRSGREPASQSATQSGDGLKSTQPSKEAKEKPITIPAQPREKRSVSFHKDLKAIMYGFGDDRSPLEESVDLMNDLVIDYITDITRQAVSVSTVPGKLKLEDFFYVLRKDPKKYNRAKELMSMKQIIRKAKQAVPKDDG